MLLLRSSSLFCHFRSLRRHFSSSSSDSVPFSVSFKELVYDNFAIHASNTYLASGFADAFAFLSVTNGYLAPSASILALNVGLRLAVFPLVVYAERLTSRRMIAVGEIRRQISEKIGAHYGIKPVLDTDKGKWTLETGDPGVLKDAEQLARKNVDEFLIKNRLNLIRLTCLRLCTFPVWMYCAMGMANYLEGLYSAHLPGFLWISTLSKADPYMILPICTGTLALMAIWSNRWMFMSKEDHFRTGTKIMDALLILFVLLGTKTLMEAPAILSLHWCCALSTSLLQSILIRHPKAKRLFGIGPLPTDSDTPFRDLLRRKRPMPMAML